MKHVVITGASSGIGRATAAELANHGYHVFGGVRRDEDRVRLRENCGANVTPLLLDVTDEESVAAAARSVRAALGEHNLTGLINNAGISVSGPLLHLSTDEIREQFDVNFFGVLSVTRAFLPLLRADRRIGQRSGRIVNIGSVNGTVTYPFVVPYCAAKHALESLSDGLRRELLPAGVDVIVVAPDAVRTAIWDKAERADMAERFAATEYGAVLAALQRFAIARGRRGIPAERVARRVHRILKSRRPKTRYRMARFPLVNSFTPRWLPDRWLDWIIGRTLRQ